MLVIRIHKQGKELSNLQLKRTEAGNTKEDNFMARLQAVRSEFATFKESIEKNRV